MHRISSIPAIAAAALCALAASPPATAQTAVDPKDVTAADVMTKPLSDLNLRKDDVPQLLLDARDRPYDLTGLRRCPAIQSAVSALDAVLGEDIDVVQEKTLAEKRGNSMGNIARSLVGSLIPFGGVIREISGANENQRQWNFAIYAGSVRRAFLKGVGQQKGCAYPARAATAADVAMLDQARAAADAKPEAKSEAGQSAGQDAQDSKRDIRFESRPVVQPVPR